MKTVESNLLVMGLPSTGKTTFISALWHVLNVENHAESPMKLVRQPGNRTYLNSIEKKWIAGEPIGRSTAAEETHITLELNCPKLEKAVSLSFPDAVGEIFKRQWTERKWSRSYAETAENASGVLLFMHANHRYVPSCIDDADVVEDEIGSEAPAPGSSPGKEWASEDAPDQVKLVDILQFLKFKGFSTEPIPIAVMVSAWDICESAGISDTPEEWVSGNSPLLHQFLEANPESFRVSYFGVSAQGGDWNQNKQELHKKDPHERVFVIDGKQKISDITHPLRWFLTDAD